MELLFVKSSLFHGVAGNEAGSVPLINLKGYVLESPMTDTFTDSNSKVPFAHRLTLISDQLYEVHEEDNY
ncbi:hypothetical protein I3843_15G132400 [Carya illinoinensis]|nr:hypothetical protein I3843_15G132400 [Carya illinoinensis]